MASPPTRPIKAEGWVTRVVITAKKNTPRTAPAVKVAMAITLSTTLLCNIWPAMPTPICITPNATVRPRLTQSNCRCDGFAFRLVK